MPTPAQDAITNLAVELTPEGITWTPQMRRAYGKAWRLAAPPKRGKAKPLANPNKVPKKQWNKWSHGAQNAFNELFREMKDKELFFHPSLQGINPFSQEQWKTVRWNAAWISADIFDGQAKSTNYV